MRTGTLTISFFMALGAAVGVAEINPHAVPAFQGPMVSRPAAPSRRAQAPVPPDPALTTKLLQTKNLTIHLRENYRDSLPAHTVKKEFGGPGTTFYWLLDRQGPKGLPHLGCSIRHTIAARHNADRRPNRNDFPAGNLSGVSIREKSELLPGGLDLTLSGPENSSTEISCTDWEAFGRHVQSRQWKLSDLRTALGAAFRVELSDKTPEEIAALQRERQRERAERKRRALQAFIAVGGDPNEFEGVDFDE